MTTITATPECTIPTHDDRALFARQLSRLGFSCVGEQHGKRIFRYNHLLKGNQPLYLLENGVFGELYLAKLGVTSTAKLILRNQLDIVLLHILAIHMSKTPPTS